MTHYEVLGVATHASDKEIKSAYRALVKKYHPDRNPSEIAKKNIVIINEAYDVLSDSVKRTAYDRQTLNPVYEHADPKATFRREFIRKKQEEARAEALRASTQKAEDERKTFHFFRRLSFPIALFALLLIADELLPSITFQEPVESMWRDAPKGGSRDRLVNYIKTTHFTIHVSDELNLEGNLKIEKITIEASPLLKIAKTMSVTVHRVVQHYPALDTLYSFIIPLPYLLLASSLFTIVNKKFTRVHFQMSFVPLIMLITTLVQLFK